MIRIAWLSNNYHFLPCMRLCQLSFVTPELISQSEPTVIMGCSESKESDQIPTIVQDHHRARHREHQYLIPPATGRRPNQAAIITANHTGISGAK